jgi:predicted phage tail protein
MTAAVLDAGLPALREVRLYGRLSQQFGRVFHLAVTTPAEAVAALCAVLPGFRRAFLGPDGQARYHVFVGRGKHRRDIGEAEIEQPVSRHGAIRFVPVVAGAKRNGSLQTIVGLVIAGVSYYYGFQPGVNFGLSMALGGVIQLLSPIRRGRDERTENTPSYAFDGPVNNVEQGGPVPLAYGRVICGSTVVSQGITTTELVIPGAYGEGLPGEPVEPTLPNWETGNGT